MSVPFGTAVNRPGCCVDRDTWRDVLEERIAEGDRAGLLAHLDTCPACAATFAELAGEWSLATLARGAAAEGADERALRLRLTAPGAAVPPRIPGIAGLELAGRGGMGAVYRGHDERLGRPVAVKLLAATLSPAARARAEREARVLARLDHPHIVRIHAAGDADGIPYIVMEWIEGRTLGRRIASGPLDARAAAGVALDLARALVAVHGVGVVHRDLKPDNVLLARGAADATAETPKLVDFGIARPEGEGLTRTTSVLGTPCCMAPEQTGLEPRLGGVTAATDIHGLGALLYWMLSGRPPYDAATPGESLRLAARGEAPTLAAIEPAVPGDLRTIVETCLRYEPVRRYASAGAVAADLERFLAGRPIAARPAGPLERLRDWSRRHPAAAVAAALCGAVAVAGVVGTRLHATRLHAATATAHRSTRAAAAARSLAGESLARLTDESIERMLRRGAALDAADLDFLRSVRDEHRRWPLEPDAAAGLDFRARGLQRVAELLLGLNRFADALDCQDDAIAALDELRRHAADPRTDTRRFSAIAGRRQLLHRLGRVPEFTAAAEATVEELVGRVAAEPDLRGPLAGALVDLAIGRSATGDPATAALFDRALELLAACRRDAGSDPALLEEEIRVLYNASLTARNAGRTDEGRGRLETLVERCDEGLARFPDREPAFTRGLLLGLTSLGSLELAAGRPDRGLALVERRIAAASAAARRRPDDPVIVGESVDAAIQLAACHEALGRVAESRDPLDRAVRLAEGAVRREPAVYDRSRVLGMALARQAHVLASCGEPAAAVAAIDRLTVVLEPWRESEEAALAIADQLALSAVILAERGDSTAAAERADRALALVPRQHREALVARLEAVGAPVARRAAQSP